MRIIGGEWGGRRINPPASMPHTRPTTDIAREGLFNIITNNLELSECSALDLFGGTGCISYELASRGVKEITIVEKDPVMHEFIRKTSAMLGMKSCTILKMDVFRFMEQATTSYDLIFAGPPYALTNIDDIPALVFQKNLLNTGGWLILEHTPRNDYKKFEGYATERKYGTTIFSIFIRRKK